eukprot:EG_transcript_66898
MAGEATLQSLCRLGLLPLAPEVGVEALKQLLFEAPTPVLTVCPLDAARLPATPYFSALRPSTAAASLESACNSSAVRTAMPDWLQALEAGNSEARQATI